jgi:hypothetical protein
MARVEVKTSNEDGKEIVIFVQKPGWEEEAKAKAIGARAFKAALDNGAILKDELEAVLIKRGIWTLEQQTELVKLANQIQANLLTLKKGGIKKSEGRKLAIEVRIARGQQMLLLAERNKYEDLTVENQVENAQFDCLVSLCTFDEEGNKIFSSLEDYRNRSTSKIANDAANALGKLKYGLDPEYYSNLPENKFLKAQGFINDKLELVDKDGRRVTVDNKPIDNELNYINENNEKVDENGVKIDVDGLPVVETQPFLED